MSKTNVVGLTPTETSYTYKDVRTSQAQAMIQAIVDRLAEAGRKKANENGRNGNIPNVKITLSSIGFSRKFVPFLLILTSEALEEKSSNDDELSIFNPAESEGGVRLQPHVWSAISPFIYTKKEREMFRTPEYYRQLQLNSRNAGLVNSLISPRFSDPNTKKAVVVLLDPLRIFAAMTRPTGGDDTGNQWDNYLITILSDKCHQVAGGEWEYTFERSPREHDKPKSKDIRSDIEKSIAAAMRRS